MRKIHKSKYAQALPGINRFDDRINFTQGEKCISFFGDGLPQPQRLIAEASNSQQRGRHTRLWSENVSSLSERGVQQALSARESKVHQWREHLNKEVDKLAKAIEDIEDSQREVLMKRQYFADMARVSDMTTKFRKHIPDNTTDDKIDDLQKEEMRALVKADNDMQQCTKDLKESQKKLGDMRKALMSEVEAKAFALNISKRCQNSSPLLSAPYIPTDHSVDQLYHPNAEEDWEKNLDDKIQSSLGLREEASNISCRTDALIKDNLSKTADTWYRTSKALQESVQEDERSLYNTHCLLETVGENIISTKQRLVSLRDTQGMSDRDKTLHLWRLQQLTYRPGPDHIRDAPVRKLEEALENLEKKETFISDSSNRNRDLLTQLEKEEERQSLLMEKITKKLHIERENCLGLRRTVHIDGVRLNDYVTNL